MYFIYYMKTGKYSCLFPLTPPPPRPTQTPKHTHKLKNWQVWSENTIFMLAVAILQWVGAGGWKITTKVQFNTTQNGKIPQACLYLMSPYLVWMSMCIYFYIYIYTCKLYKLINLFSLQAVSWSYTPLLGTGHSTPEEWSVTSRNSL